MKYKLSEIAEIVAGGTPSTKESAYWNGKIPWITPKDLSTYKKRYISQGERNITEQGLNNSSAVMLPKNTILFTSRAPIGYIAIAENKLCTNQGFKSLVCDDLKCYFLYLYYWVLNNIEYIKSQANGSTFQEISGSVMKNIEIDLPSINIQKKIAGILDCIDKKIELNNQINDNLQEQLRYIFNNMFFNKIQNNDIKDYKEQILYDVLDVIDNRGKTPQLVEISDYPIIDVKAISGENRIIDYKHCQKYVSEEVYNSFFRSGHPRINDILISTVGSLAEMKIYKENKGTIAQNVVALRSKIKYPMYIYQYLKAIKNDLISYNIGSVQPSIKVTQFMNHNIYFPKENELEEFEKIAQVNTDKMFNISKENESLENLRDTLLPKLMSGEINLDKIDI